MRLPHARAECCEPAEGALRVQAARCHAHQPAQPQARQAGDDGREGGDVLGAGAAALLRRNLAVYGLGGVIVPFIGIKAIDIVVTALGVK